MKIWMNLQEKNAMALRHKIKTEDGTEIVELTARKAIIKFCSECMGYQSKIVRGCTAKTCPLWPFRVAGSEKDTVDEDGKWVETRVKKLLKKSKKQKS